MLIETNKLLEQYDYIIKYVWAIFPFIVTIIMAYIAYEQYKINKYIEYCKFDKDLNILKITVKEKIDSIVAILNNKADTINKQKEIIKITEDIATECQKFESTIEKSDIELIKKSYNKFKKWIELTENYKWNIKEIWSSFLILSEFISYVVFSENYYFSTPNKSITLYELIGIILKKTYKFFIPYWLQKFIKSFYNPLKLRILLLISLIPIMIAFVKPLILIFLSIPKIIIKAIITVFSEKMNRNIK